MKESELPPQIFLPTTKRQRIHTPFISFFNFAFFLNQEKMVSSSSFSSCSNSKWKKKKKRGKKEKNTLAK